MTAMRMQSVPILMEASLAHAYQATLEMEGVALVRNRTKEILLYHHCLWLISWHTKYFATK